MAWSAREQMLNDGNEFSEPVVETSSGKSLREQQLDGAWDVDNYNPSEEQKELNAKVHEDFREKAIEAYKRLRDPNPSNPSDPNMPYYTGSAAPTQKWSYLNADLAKAYHMSKSTAYQEALANTAHQREMADYKAAGLNPVLAAGAGSGAGVFAGTDMYSGGSGVSGGGSKKEEQSLLGRIFSSSGAKALASAAASYFFLKAAPAAGAAGAVAKGVSAAKAKAAGQAAAGVVGILGDLFSD